MNSTVMIHEGVISILDIMISYVCAVIGIFEQEQSVSEAINALGRSSRGPSVVVNTVEFGISALSLSGNELKLVPSRVYF